MILNRPFCLHDYRLSTPMETAIFGMVHQICTKCGKTEL